MSLVLLAAVPLLPWLAAVSCAIVGKRLGRACGVVLSTAIAAALVIAIALAGGRVAHGWLVSGALNLSAGLELTPLTRLGALLVLSVSLIVSLYAIGYVERRRASFFAMLGFFVGAMTLLVLASSFVLLFAAWELVGLGSFLMIGFHTHENAGAAATSALLSTRSSDVALLLGWLLIVLDLGGDGIGAALGWRSGSTAIAMLLVTLGIMGKSAQLPLSSWLPAAMVAPTPVSALLHSSTMVAAGVFLMLRLYPLVAATPAALTVLIVVGGVSALFGALAAAGKCDLKRLLAWSTVAQIGEMLVVLGLGGPFAATLQLVAHAAFKATLFLGAGIVQQRSGSTELAKLGGMARALPLSGVAFAIGALALAGVPPLSGYWSEDAMLASALPRAVAAASLAVLAGLAALYIGRAAGRVLLGDELHVNDAAKPTPIMVVAAAAMAIGALMVGGLLAGPLAGAIPFTAPRDVATGWRIALLVIVILGAVAGVLASRSIATLPLGHWTQALPSLLDRIMGLPIAAVRMLAASAERCEILLDRIMGFPIAAVQAVAASAARCEIPLDRAVSTAAWLLFASGRLSAHAERSLENGGDRLATATNAGGERLRLVQSGDITFYLALLGTWVAVAITLAALLIWT